MATKGQGFSWHTPKIWPYIAPQNNMQLATFITPALNDPYAENPHTSALLSLTFIEGDSGSWQANINRWQQQLALPNAPIQPTFMQTSLGNVQFVKLFNKETQQGILAAIYNEPQGTLFVKLHGFQKTLTEQAQAFVQFVESIQKEGSKN